jgi:hypothetical protein
MSSPRIQQMNVCNNDQEAAYDWRLSGAFATSWVEEMTV